MSIISLFTCDCLVQQNRPLQAQQPPQPSFLTLHWTFTLRLVCWHSATWGLKLPAGYFSCLSASTLVRVESTPNQRQIDQDISKFTVTLMCFQLCCCLSCILVDFVFTSEILRCILVVVGSVSITFQICLYLRQMWAGKRPLLWKISLKILIIFKSVKLQLVLRKTKGLIHPQTSLSWVGAAAVSDLSS